METSQVSHPEWTRRANLYEVNLRQYTPEGRLDAFQRHLPRLQRMGVDILWLMPIHPIGRLNRKGSLGSPYAVSDHLAVHPDLGELEDLRCLVRVAHAHGMKVIIDWVANHTAWDHRWVREHPDWYLKDARGEIHSYVYDNGRELEHWTDVVGLDYANPAVWGGMIEALEHWVVEAGIDGYRCDVASLVPTPFWERARARLEAIKPVFMLAESSSADLHRQAFDMTYDWSLHDVMRKVARGDADGGDLAACVAAAATVFPPDGYRMTFTSNHDKNAWEGHDREMFGEAFAACAVLAATLPGMPLIYGGQESSLDRRLAFFEKDPIDWKDFPLADFYADLLRLKHEHPALANGAAGAPVQRVVTYNPALFAFRREQAGDAVGVVVNLSGRAQPVHVPGFDAPRALSPWGWHIQH